MSAFASLEDIIFSHSEIAKGGTLGVSLTTVAGSKVSTNIAPDGNNIRFIYSWTLTGPATGTCFLSFYNVRSWDGRRIELNTATIATIPFQYPFIIVKSGSGATIDIQDTNAVGAAGQAVTMGISYFDIPDDPVIWEKLQKFVNLNFKI